MQNPLDAAFKQPLTTPPFLERFRVRSVADAEVGPVLVEMGRVFERLQAAKPSELLARFELDRVEIRRGPCRLE